MTATDDKAVQAVKAAIKEAGIGAKVQTRKNLPKAIGEKAKALKCDPGAIVRAELYVIGDTPVLALLSGSRACREDQLERIFFVKGKVTKAKADQVRALTGFTLGGLGPCGHSTKMPIAIDVALKAHDRLFAAAGRPDAYFSMDVSALKRLTGGIVSYALAQDR